MGLEWSQPKCRVRGWRRRRRRAEGDEPFVARWCTGRKRIRGRRKRDGEWKRGRETEMESDERMEGRNERASYAADLKYALVLHISLDIPTSPHSQQCPSLTSPSSSST
jgi:hypothetical protein